VSFELELLSPLRDLALRFYSSSNSFVLVEALTLMAIGVGRLGEIETRERVLSRKLGPSYGLLETFRPTYGLRGLSGQRLVLKAQELCWPTYGLIGQLSGCFHYAVCARKP
jgi:hypothetical protein